MSHISRVWIFVLFATAMLAALLVLDGRSPMGRESAEISYTRFKSLVSDAAVEEVLLRGHEVSGTLKSAQALGPDDTETRSFETRLPAVGAEGIVQTLEDQGVNVRVEKATEGNWRWLIFVLPWLLIIGLYFFMARRMAQSMGGAMGGFRNLGETKAKTIEPDRPQATFDDVAGQEGAKREVEELVEFLRDPDRYRGLGAEVPHGILLVGPPGTGKTLMARALAGEAGVPFLFLSGSEFIEMVVGVGAARVRKTFEEAKKQQPSILFIDEFDAIGRVRGAGLGGGHDEREQTLNQILNEMDGFSPREAVVVLAATNRPDVLDPALLRPGRFDRRVSLELPDKPARRKILEVHVRDVPLADDVDLDRVAAGSPGFSGADLRNLVNEAAIAAARQHSKEVTAAHFDEARDKLLMGPERPLAIRPEDRHRIAVHECGHTAVAYYLPNADPLYKVTIIPHGRSLGGTHQLPEEERYNLAEDYLRDRLAVMLAGRTAEQEFLGNVSSGADNDIQQATQLARAMVSRWGMSERIGPVDLRESDDHPFLGREMTQQRRFSDTTAHLVDEAVKSLIVSAEERAREAIRGHRERVEALIEAVEENETLDRQGIVSCLDEGSGKKRAESKPKQAANA